MSSQQDDRITLKEVTIFDGVIRVPKRENNPLADVSIIDGKWIFPAEIDSDTDAHLI